MARLSAAEIASSVGLIFREFVESKFSVDDNDVPIIERFLYSPVMDNRSAALDVLVMVGERAGYEADAIQLFFDAANNSEYTIEGMAVIRLSDLASRGSLVAERVLYNLQRDGAAQLLAGDKGFQNPELDERLAPKKS